MTADRAITLASRLILLAAFAIALIGAALLIRPELAPAGQGANAQGVRIVGGVLLLAAAIKIGVLILINRMRFRTGALPPDER